MREYIVQGFNPEEKAGANISWRAIFAGVVTFLALNVLFSLISAAIGLGVPDFTTANPFSGASTGLIIWTVISIILSLAASGYIAGLTANRAGFIHGFLTWATSTVVGVLLIGQLLGAVFNAAGTVISAGGQAVGSVASTVGNVAQQAGVTAGSLTQDAFDSISQQINVDTSNLDAEVEQVLRDTNIEQLQPEYFQAQVDATVQDISDAAYAIVVEGKEAGPVVQQVADNVEARVQSITSEIDRDALTQAVSQNSDLSQAEVDSAVDNILETYNQTAQEAEKTLNQASQKVEELAQQGQQLLEEGSVALESGIEEGVQVADDVTNETAKYSIWIFIALLAGLFISSFAGYAGAKTTQETNSAAV
ncbi:hypothetical protein ACWOBE_01470 [Hutsoniella sourekii]